MRVLVTGGTGYLGRAIVRAVVAAGHRAVVFARRASGSGLPGELVNGDVRDRDALMAAAAGADAVIHAAALVSIWRRRAADFDEINVGGLENALAVVRALALPRLVYTSSFMALPPGASRTPLCANDYQRTKVAARRLAGKAAADGLPIVSLYPGVVYGPGVATEGNLVGRLVRDHLRGRLPGVIGASRIWSCAFVDDVADAHVQALTRGTAGAEYALGGENTPQRRIFEIVQQGTGRPMPRTVPVAVARLAGWIEETRVRITGGTPLLTRGAVEIFSHDWPLDSAAAIRDLGYRVRPLEEGLRLTLAELA